MVLLSLGAAAKPVTQNLFRKGYRALDIGNLDMEYEWFLQGALQKTKLAKHGIIGRSANLKAGYETYVREVEEDISGTEERLTV